MFNGQLAAINGEWDILGYAVFNELLMGFNGEPPRPVRGCPKCLGGRHAMPWAENGNKTEKLFCGSWNWHNTKKLA